MSQAPGHAAPWWQGGVVYQIYPRSWADANGDGIGDVQGIVNHLDYLEWLGVDVIWINPITASPNRDWGYDVTDYCSVHPDFGSLDDVDDLIRECHARDIKVLLDLVPNHTSDQHPWFRESRSDRAARRRDWYLWADPKTDGAPPNNWLAEPGGPSWTFDAASEQYYLHSFLGEQPDLNWRNREVRDAFEDILRFWFDRGVDGFRVDVAYKLIKDRQLRDNPSATSSDHPLVQAFGQVPHYNGDQPEVHDIFKEWRTLADGYEFGRVFIGETFFPDPSRIAAYYGAGDELHLAFNNIFAVAPFMVSALARIVAASEQALMPLGWPAWAISNHDFGRYPTRWCDGEGDAVRCAAMLLLTLRGTPILYYGDELGASDVPVPPSCRRDPFGQEDSLNPSGRDGARTPMPWANRPGGGFTTAEVEPWLPLGDLSRCNVADQQADPNSMLHLCRDLIRLRREFTDLALGEYQEISCADPVWRFKRGDTLMVVLNLSDRPAQVNDLDGTILVGTDRGREGAKISGNMQLSPWEGLLVKIR